jgi:hypothetical protein
MDGQSWPGPCGRVKRPVTIPLAACLATSSGLLPAAVLPRVRHHEGPAENRRSDSPHSALARPTVGRRQTVSATRWLKEQRPTPYGGPPPQWGNRDRATSSALVVYDQYRDDAGWLRCLALHRHGGIELSRGNFAYQVRETRVFPLRQIVGLAWVAAALQSEVADRWHLNSPFELTVALRNTSRATLGSFAEGWAEPGTGFWDFTTCIEDQVLLRWEVDDRIDPEKLALALGDRLEQAFGSTHRRHLAHRGDYDGRFDPRFGF